ncbi:MAG: STAS-like domain-containing protein [Nanoarchaeota archaeon]|nr:STAS-like domain-containing protein [Nanoarchaeota archaeon]
MEIKLYEYVGTFAENKDIAKDIRINKIIPSLENSEEITLDFDKVKSATQSFVHALISDVIRKNGIKILDRVYFKNCSDTIKKIIEIVIEYMQDHS